MSGAHATRSRLRAVPVAVWAISALWVALMLGATVLWPAGYGIDEPDHVDTAYIYAGAPTHLYAPGAMHYTRASINLRKLIPAAPPRPKLDLVKEAPRSQRPTLTQLGGRSQPDTLPEQMEQHPPLFYWLGAAVLSFPGVSSLAWDLQFWLLRLISVVVMAPIPLLCWATTKRLLDSRAAGEIVGRAESGSATSRLAILGALVPLTVPNLIREGGSYTNDSLLFLTSSVLLYFVTRVVTGDRSGRTATWIAASLAAALWTKGFALTFPPIVAAAYLVGTGGPFGSGWFGRLPWRSLAIAAIGAAVGGLWWLRNVVDYHAIQVNGYGPGWKLANYGPPDNHGTLARFLPNFVIQVVNRTWGEIGLPDLPAPGPFVIYGWFIVVAIGLLAGLGGRRRDRATAGVLFMAPTFALLVLGAGVYVDYHMWSNELRGTQGRYLYHTIVVVAAVTTVGWLRLLRPRFIPRLLLLTFLGAVLTNAASWLLVVRSWYATKSGLSGLVHGVRTVLYLSPVPEPVTLVLLILLPTVAAIIGLFAVATDLRWLARRGDAVEATGAGR